MRSSVLMAFVLMASMAVAAQGPPAGRGACRARPAVETHSRRVPRAAAPVDFTGYWVSVVTEDWRWRMVTPAKGDFAGGAAQRRRPQAWSGLGSGEGRSRGHQCKAYGAAGIMRMPGRLHITWQDDTTLKIDTDQGTQTRC